MTIRKALCLSFLLALSPVATADTALPPERAAAASHWRALARLDLDAAYALLRDSHPAMAPELGDTAFISQIDAAYAQAKTRIETVDSFYGLRATLEAFGNASGDKHVGAGFGLMRQYTIWPQFLVRLQGTDYIVTRAAGDTSTAPAEGDRLVSCDGIAADEIARQRLGEYHANWQIEAQRAAQSWRLFVNDRNPFLPPLVSCRFQHNAEVKDVSLSWSSASYDVVAPVIIRTDSSQGAGFGVKRLPNGAYWISMEHLDQDAETVIAEVQKQARAIASAPYVVVDVRGNGGGSSSYGERLAQILFKDVKEDPADDSGVSAEAWRVSPGNADAMAKFAADARANTPDNKSLVDWAQETATMLHEGVTSGARFVPALPKTLSAPLAFQDPKGGTPGAAKVYLLTDHACFSSCLLMTDRFKSLGAVQIGLPTDAATRYMEVRSDLLPSRLVTFSTLQKVALGAPAWLGPYEPAVRFNGDMSDTKALERWVQQVAAGKVR